MKHVLLLFALVIFCAPFRSSGQSCCAKPGDMQLLAFNEAFKAAHLPPEPFEYTPEAGAKMITFPTQGGVAGNAFFIPSKEPSDKILLVFHEWWGLNDYIKQEAQRWYDQMNGKVNVYAVDLYDGKVAANPDEAGKLMGGLTQKRGEAIVNGLLKKIGQGKQIATIGWCMGGTWSFNATLLAGKDSKGCVMYYGFPEKDQNRVKMLYTDVLYIRGAMDKFITQESVTNLGNEVKADGHEFEYRSYEADHAFANPSNPKYDKQHTQEANDVALDFLTRKLKL